MAEVQAWDDDTMDMYFDGEHHFGISTREVVLKHKTGSEGIISVSTDLWIIRCSGQMMQVCSKEPEPSLCLMIIYSNEGG